MKINKILHGLRKSGPATSPCTPNKEVAVVKGRERRAIVIQQGTMGRGPSSAIFGVQT
jgi:hypothetical protein